MSIWKSGSLQLQPLPCRRSRLKAMPTEHRTRTHVYAKKFSGKYVHRVIKGGIGHNLPQEAPQAFAEAVIEADGL